MVEQPLDTFRRSEPLSTREGPVRSLLPLGVRGGLLGAPLLGLLVGLLRGPNLSDHVLGALAGVAAGWLGGGVIELAGRWLYARPALDPTLLGRPTHLRCGCGAEVPFTVIEAGGSVACPKCGRQVSVPSLSRLRESDWTPPE